MDTGKGLFMFTACFMAFVGVLICTDIESETTKEIMIPISIFVATITAALVMIGYQVEKTSNGGKDGEG